MPVIGTSSSPSADIRRTVKRFWPPPHPPPFFLFPPRFSQTRRVFFFSLPRRSGSTEVVLTNDGILSFSFREGWWPRKVHFRPPFTSRRILLTSLPPPTVEEKLPTRRVNRFLSLGLVPGLLYSFSSFSGQLTILSFTSPSALFAQLKPFSNYISFTPSSFFSCSMD